MGLVGFQENSQQTKINLNRGLGSGYQCKGQTDRPQGQHWTGRYRGETRGMDGRDLGATAEDTGRCGDGHGA